MKILWIVNHQMEDICLYNKKEKKSSGSWLTELSRGLAVSENIELNIIYPSNGERETHVMINNITYYGLNMSFRDKFIKPSKRFKLKIKKLVDCIEPDIIHLQGSEFAYGLTLLNINRCPIVISIQGLISEINKYYLGGIKKIEMLDPIISIPLAIKYIRNRFRGESELIQLKCINYIIGRTNWDRAHSYYNNQNSKYFKLDESLRKAFVENKWELNNSEEDSIFCAGGIGNPIKGAHKLIECIAILKKEFPSIKLKIIGDNLMKKKRLIGYERYIFKIINKFDLKNNIEFLGNLTEKEMVRTFQSSRVYVMSSSIENSSNTLMEAMSLGVPSIVPFIGGVPSICDEKSVLFYRFGDINEMCWQIRKVLKNDDLASNLSKYSLKYTDKKYDGKKNSENLVNIYYKIINSTK